MSSLSMTDRELEALLTDLESDRVERKESLGGDAPKKIRQAICAFANDLPGSRLPGVVFVGARDDGTPSGLPVTDELLRTLADKTSVSSTREGVIVTAPTTYNPSPSHRSTTSAATASSRSTFPPLSPRRRWR